MVIFLWSVQVGLPNMWRDPSQALAMKLANLSFEQVAA
jgi:hypothetical protein